MEEQNAKHWSAVCFLLRFPLGILFLFAGVGKFIMGYSTVTTYILKEMLEKTWLPKIMLVPYIYTLPFVETILGVLLIVGLFTRPAIFITGLLLTSLMFGKILASDSATVAQIGNYIFMTAMAYYFSKHNRFSLDNYLLRKS